MLRTLSRPAAVLTAAAALACGDDGPAGPGG
jgi:hypothetical protein